MEREMLVRLGKANYPAGIVEPVKCVVALLFGLALGHGLMWGAGFLGYELMERMEAQPYEDRLFLGGLMLTLSLVALVLSAVAIATRRQPGWLCAFMLGAAAASPLTLFSVFFMVPSWQGD
jgi:hypothetical protein